MGETDSGEIEVLEAEVEDLDIELWMEPLIFLIHTLSVDHQLDYAWKMRYW